MSERFTAAEISRIVRTMRSARTDHDERLRRRRMLIEMATEAYVESNGTGTNIPPPFTKSSLAIQVMLGDIVKAQQQYTAIFTANTPQITVTPIVPDGGEASGRVDKRMGEQERLLNSLWEMMGGPAAQKKIGASQAWGRVGWYFVMPRDDLAGMPERRYYADLSDAEITQLKRTGGLTPEPIESPDGRSAYAESGDSYVSRRREAGRARAADSLFTLMTFPPDVVYAAPDADGVKWAAACLEVPSFEFGPSSSYARSHAARSAPEGIDTRKWGLYFDKSQRRVVGGITAGGEYDVLERWTYTIFATREEVYCLVSDTPDGVGELVWYSEHLGGRCPIIPAPAFYTDSSRPGGEYSSPMEALFAIAAPFNQAMTLLALATSWNATSRWVLVRPDGELVPDEATGDPKVVAFDNTALGLDPTKIEVVAGAPMQLQLNVDSLFKLAEFYEAKKDTYSPSAAVIGGEGYAGSTAWGMQQAIAQGLADMKQPVDNHAAAVKEIMLLCIAWLRQREEPIYAISLPGERADARSVSGLIEFDPQHLVTAIAVKQSSSTQQAKIVARAAGQEALQAGTVTLRGFYEQFTDEDDARAAEINIYADRLFQMAAFGSSVGIEQGSIAYDYMLALRGEMSQKMLALPAVAIKTATDMALDAQTQAAQQTLQQEQAAQGGLPPGVAEPGLGMATTPPAGDNVASPMLTAPVGAA